jgi:hypothetical protein
VSLSLYRTTPQTASTEHPQRHQTPRGKPRAAPKSPEGQARAQAVSLSWNRKPRSEHHNHHSTAQCAEDGFGAPNLLANLMAGIQFKVHLQASTQADPASFFSASCDAMCSARAGIAWRPLTLTPFSHQLQHSPSWKMPSPWLWSSSRQMLKGLPSQRPTS